MKKILTIVAFIAIVVATHGICLAQANSVNLKDGPDNLLSSHSSIQEAYNAIPATLTQAYGIEITNSYTAANEIFPVTFVSKTGASATNTIKVYIESTIVTLNVNCDGSLSSTFVFDDADWVYINGRNANGGIGLRLVNSASSLDHPIIQLINGACHNRIDSIILNPGLTNILPTPALALGTSVSNISGNSDNQIRGCIFNNSVTCIASEGTANNTNKNNRIINNTLHSESIGIQLKAGTGNMLIDSNYIHVNFYSNQIEKRGIVAEDVSDSLLITRNRIRCYLFSTSMPQRGVHIKSTTGTGAYTHIANNFIYFQAADNQLGEATDLQTDIAGIDFDGNYAVKADIYHNTIRIREKLKDTVTATALSTCFKRSGDNVNNIFNIRNNIFSTERYGGVNAEHLSMLLDHTSGSLTIDHNDYVSITGDVVKYNNVVYSSFATYQAAIGGGNEVNSNTAVPEFPGPTDFHIYGSMIGNPLFYGVAIPGLGMDKEDDPRTNHYRGCDEYVVNCLSQPIIIYNPPNFLCEGDSFLYYTGYPWTGNGNTWQWEWRPAATTVPFADIPGKTHYAEILYLTQSSDIRVRRSCADNSFTVYSAIHTTIVNPLPSAGQILVTNNGLVYHFSTSNPINITLFQWDFGDGSPLDSTGLPQHEYADTGTYIVTLIITNNCGSDTLTYTITPPVVGLENLMLANSISLYPNPAVNAVKITAGNNTINDYIMYNITGVQVLTESPATNEVEINTSTLPSGVYTIRLNTDKGTTYKRLQILR